MVGLSIEEKAKAYDEALKVLHKYDGANIMFTQDLKEEMFPELKENMDERIRKKLISYFSAVKGFSSLEYNYGITGEDVIAWLKKQGEHTPKHKVGDTIYYNSFGEVKSMIVDNVITDGTDNPMYEDKEGGAVFEKDLVEQKSLDLVAIMKNYFANTPKEQQEKDWAELKRLNNIGFDIEIPFGAKDSELEEVSYDIPKGYHAEIEDNKVVIKKGEKKSAEWSEEKEKGFNTAIQHIENYVNNTPSSQRPEIWADITKLKSLRPHSQWKPSEEEMKALEFCIEHNIDKDGVFGSKVVKMYNELKKLMEE